MEHEVQPQPCFGVVPLLNTIHTKDSNEYKDKTPSTLETCQRWLPWP